MEYSAGAPVPDGWVIATRRRDGLMLGGAVLTAVSYVMPLFASVVCERDHGNGECGASAALLPVVGPILQVAADDGLASAMKTALIASTVGQLGGIALIITGVALEQRVLVPAGVPVSAAPVVGPSFAGIAVGGSTF